MLARTPRVFLCFFLLTFLACDNNEPYFPIFTCSGQFENSCCSGSAQTSCCINPCSNFLNEPPSFNFDASFFSQLLAGTLNATYTHGGPWSVATDGTFGSVGSGGGFFSGTIFGASGEPTSYSCTVGASTTNGFFSLSCTGSGSSYFGNINYGCQLGGLLCTGGVDFDNDGWNASCGANGSVGILGHPVTIGINGSVNSDGNGQCTFGVGANF